MNMSPRVVIFDSRIQHKVAFTHASDRLQAIAIKCST